VSTAKVSDVLGPLPELRNYCMALLLAVILAAVIATLMLSALNPGPFWRKMPIWKDSEHCGCRSVAQKACTPKRIVVAACDGLRV